MPPQVILIWYLISLWKTSLATSQIFGHLARCMKTIYCMVEKDAQSCLCKTAGAFWWQIGCFLSPGLSCLLVFHDTVPNVFKLVDDNDNGMIQNISKAIHRECKNLVHDKNKYTIRVDKQTGINSVSATLISLLENLSDNPWFKLPSIVIGNIITNAVTSANTTSNWTWCYPWQEKPCATISWSWYLLLKWWTISGHICQDEVNVHDALDLGKTQMERVWS